MVTPNKLLDGLDKAKAAAEAKAAADAKLAAERKAADQLGLIDNSKIITEPHKTAIVALAIPELKGKATLLFRASDHGWSGNDFHARCDDKGRTLTLIKTTKGRSCGGFTSVPWGKGGVYKDDPTAFLFSLDLQKVYWPTDVSKAVTHGNTWGPGFGNWSLTARDNLKEGYCRTNGNNEFFNIPTDAEGNSVLTGDGKGQPDKYKKFSIEDLEVYLIE